jgi:hypothetical protein
MEATLSRLVKACGARKGNIRCPLIATLHAQEPNGRVA